MLSAAQRLALLLAAALLCAAPARALIIYGTGPNDLNNSLNVLAPNILPPNGAPSCNVIQFGPGSGSGIYLGNGYILTAKHVGVNVGIVINGVNYSQDTTFDPLHISENVATTAFEDFTDLQLVKIVGNPGLPPLPVVQKLPINYSATDDLAATSTLIAWGVGKGSVVPFQGWNGGDGSTFAQRWGTNSAPGVHTQTPFQNYGYLYDALYLNFNRNLGPNTAQLAFVDSGSALLQQIGGAWTVSGIATLGYSAYYDGNLIAPGDQPNSSVFVRLQKYAHLLRYENWANTKLGNPAASLTADPDGDGVKNVLEYAFHTDPNAASSTALPQAGVESGYVTLTYTQLMSATDLIYAVEQSSDLTNPLAWGPATVIQEIVSTSGVTRVVKAKVALGIATQRFLRLNVTKLP